ncbi:relaxase [Elizabethkingia miricola]|uniref:conjugal transfer protein MobB n=1 Tax=Elizabethkingia miricola TaxID=172045 RepID=UPI0009992C6F|nr:conjugal transfer protein MobB [Elizabethkingia miricola]OPB86635.1 relaxase [Elizabethkingia miricola]
MIARIGRGANMMGVLSYNQIKVDQTKGEILATNRIWETPDGKYTVAQLFRSFAPYLTANLRTEKPVLHISLNPDPKDKVSDEQFREIADQYMLELGYAEQPYIVFKHTDIDRTHIHIVSTCVDRYGKKISDSYEKLRSMDICRALEQKYGLIPATEKQAKKRQELFKPVDHQSGDLKSQIAAVVRYLPRYYQYQSLGAYNALLSLFNITAEEVKGELHGQPRQGLVYFALNANGEKVSNPFKASLFGKQAGHAGLQKHYTRSKDEMAKSTTRFALKNSIEIALQLADNEADFKKNLTDQGINVVIRRNAEGRIYGITFIDHESRSVWNGSQLGKELSANVFNALWKDKALPSTVSDNSNTTMQLNPPEEHAEIVVQVHDLFHFVDNRESDLATLVTDIGCLLPDLHEEEYPEPSFVNKKKKRKGRSGGQY